MADYKRPDTYIEFKDAPVRVIEGVNAATLALVGLAEKGPVAGVDGGEAKLVTSWNQFVSLFGSAYSTYLLAEAAFQYFAQGGSRLYVSRVAPADAAKAFFNLLDTAATPVSVVRVEALYPGLYGEGIEVTVEGDASTKTITIAYAGSSEVITAVGVSPAVIVEAINAGSKLVKASKIADGNSIVSNQSKTPLDNGADGTVISTPSGYLGAAADRKGAHAFDTVREVMAVACPDASVNLAENDLKTLTTDMNTLFEASFLGVFYADAPMDKTAIEVANYFDSLTQGRCYSKWYSWLKMNGVYKEVYMPGSVIGAMMTAIVTAKKGVHVAAAGTDFPVKNVVAPVYDISDADQDLLYPKGINCIRRFPAYGMLVWGTRTAATDVKWQQINVVRLFQALALGLKDGLKWVVFKPNTQDTWDNVVATVTDFMLQYYRDGAFAGTTMDNAFFVKCDETLNTPEVQEQGKMITQVGAAPAIAGEFIVIELGQWQEGQSVSVS